jgi:class 3 adenylate cyclase
VRDQVDFICAEVYKTYLHCASKIIKSRDGEITAFDGDRVMAVFLGDFKNNNATRAALEITDAVQNIINPAMKGIYSNSNFSVHHRVGIDAGHLFIARTGVRGDNDLVWVGNAANYAAKLSALRDGGYTTWITQRVFDRLNDNLKLAEGNQIWISHTWKSQGDQQIYGSTYLSKLG